LTASSRKKRKSKAPGKRPSKAPTKAKVQSKKKPAPAKKAVKATPPVAASPPKTPPPGAKAPSPATPAAAKVAKATSPKRPSRKSLLQRRGPDGQLLAAGELLLPLGPQTGEEIQYLLRGCVAAERPAGEAGIAAILQKKAPVDAEAERTELVRHLEMIVRRFDSGTIEPFLPGRPQSARRNFQSVVDRAKLRRREIGAFLRGLDLGRTETSHMDSHGEASLQSLMEWAARLENLAEADEPDQADYAMFHRGLDQLENTTEALIIDVELTLRRLRDRTRAS